MSELGKNKRKRSNDDDEPSPSVQLSVKEFDVAKQIIEICLKRGLMGRVTGIDEQASVVACHTALKASIEDQTDIDMKEVLYVCRFIGLAAEHGVIHPAEFMIVGTIYAKFHKFISINNKPSV